MVRSPTFRPAIVIHSHSENVMGSLDVEDITGIWKSVLQRREDYRTIHKLSGSEMLEERYLVLNSFQLPTVGLRFEIVITRVSDLNIEIQGIKNTYWNISNFIK